MLMFCLEKVCSTASPLLLGMIFIMFFNIRLVPLSSLMLLIKMNSSKMICVFLKHIDTRMFLLNA
jgi:hypothetical protein